MNEFVARNGIISKSNLIVSGSLTALSTITAQTLVVQTITSSISSITGSTNFGSLAANTHTFTGSMSVSGSGTFGGALSGTSATFSSNIAIAGAGLSAWGGTFGVMQSYYGSYFGGTSGGGTVMGNNNYFDGTNYKYISTDFAGQIQIGSGNILLRVAASGTSGNNVTFTNALTISSTGAATFSSSVAASTSITVTNSGGQAAILSAVSSFADGYRATLRLWNQHTGGKAWEVYSTNNSDGVYGGGKLAFVNSTDSITAMTMTSGGNVGIGTTSPSRLLDARGTVNLSTTNPTVGTTSGAYADVHLRTFSGYPSAQAKIVVVDYWMDFYSTYTDGFRWFNYDSAGTTPVERMRITSGGKIQVNSPSDTGPRFSIKGSDNDWTIGVAATSTTGQSYGILITAGTNSSDNSFYVQNAAGNTKYFQVRGDGYLFSPPTYNNTFASAANMYVNTDGSFGRATSSLKYKENVIDYTKGLAEVMQLRAVSYTSKNLQEKGQTFAGLIAEEVHDLGLIEFVQYAEDGSPDALAYQNMIALAFKAIQELKAEIEILKNK